MDAAAQPLRCEFWVLSFGSIRISSELKTHNSKRRLLTYGRKTRMRKHRCLMVCLAIVLAGATAFGISAQVRYATGQNVAPVFEGWEQNPDGTSSMIFGYLNRNYEEEVDIPIGPNNTIDPGGDRGQPTHFYARRQRF